MVLPLVFACFACNTGGGTTLDGSSDLAPSSELRDAASYGSPDYLMAVAACLEGRGYTTSVDVAEGSISWDRPPGDEAKSEEAFDACESELSESGVIEPPADLDKRLTESYEFLKGTFACMKDHGYRTPQGPPPLDVYIDTQGAWHPYDPYYEVEELDVGAIQQLERDCPQDPNA